MKKLWNRISNLGINFKNSSLDRRNTILANQINIILFGITFVLFITIRLDGFLSNKPMGMGTLRLLAIMVMTIINLMLAHNSWNNTNKFILIFLTPLISIVFPTLYGFVEEESYLYYPFVIIALSIIPQLILPFNKKRGMYFIAIIYYLALLISIDVLLNEFNNHPSVIFTSISEFYLEYKIISIAIFLFTCYSIFYLRSINYLFEKKLTKKNLRLDAYNEELKSTIDNLKDTQKQLVHAEKMAALGNLTAGISHEINNPLNYISGGLFYIEETIEKLRSNNQIFDTEDIAESLTKTSFMVEKGVRKASQIVNLLTVFSLQKTAQKKQVNLTELINGTLCFISIKANNEIEIKKEFNYTNDVHVHYDQIHQVILNIFNNAIDAILLKPNETNHYIFVKTYVDENDMNKPAVIEIFNTGVPIKNEHLLKVFEPFFTTKELTMSTGLGLSIAYSIITEHNGTIEAINKANGVSFIIKLPSK